MVLAAVGFELAIAAGPVRADPAKPAQITVTKAKPTAPTQVASLATGTGITVGTKDKAATAPLLLQTPQFRLSKTLLGPPLDDEAGTIQPPLTDGDNPGARFLPLLKETTPAPEPLNRNTNFFDSHEFGIQLRSKF